MTIYHVVEQPEGEKDRIYKTAYAVKTMRQKLADVMDNVESYITRGKVKETVEIDDKIDEYIVKREPVRRKREEIRNVIVSRKDYMSELPERD